MSNWLFNRWWLHKFVSYIWLKQVFSEQILSTSFICTVLCIKLEKITTTILHLKLSKKKLKNRSNFLDKCLILHCFSKIKGIKIMFGAGAKVLLARYGLDIWLYLLKYFQKDQVNFLTVQLCQIIFMVFVKN